MNFKEITRRGERGLLMESNEFLMKRVAAGVPELQKKYNINWDGKTLVNLDDDLADRCWQAGKELILHTGLYSMNSSRVIEFSAEEIDSALRFTPSRLMMGQARTRWPSITEMWKIPACLLSSAVHSMPIPTKVCL